MIDYDFRFDEKVMNYSTKDKIERMLQFVLNGRDCELEPEAIEIYKKTSGCYGKADVMTSFWTSMLSYIRFLYAEKYGNIYLLDLKKSRNGSWCVPSKPAIYKKYRANKNKKIWACYLLKYKDVLSEVLSEKSKDFFAWNHTIGNFISVSENFNAKRGRNILGSRWNAEWDYVDLMLWAIYAYYHKEDATGWYNIFMPNENCGDKEREKIIKHWMKVFSDESVSQWLEKLESWDNFVERNRLQDFVEKNLDDTFDKPKLLWKEHTWTKYENKDTGKLYGPVPRTKEQFEVFFGNCTKRIQERGKRMCEKV